MNDNIEYERKVRSFISHHLGGTPYFYLGWIEKVFEAMSYHANDNSFVMDDITVELAKSYILEFYCGTTEPAWVSESHHLWWLLIGVDSFEKKWHGHWLLKASVPKSLKGKAIH